MPGFLEYYIYAPFDTRKSGKKESVGRKSGENDQDFFVWCKKEKWKEGKVEGCSFLPNAPNSFHAKGEEKWKELTRIT